jgi:hypothetical protein
MPLPPNRKRPDHAPAGVDGPPLDRARLVGLLTDLDAFLRSSPTVLADLTQFLARCGHPHPGFTAGNIVDELSFTVVRLGWAGNAHQPNPRDVTVKIPEICPRPTPLRSCPNSTPDQADHLASTPEFEP